MVYSFSTSDLPAKVIEVLNFWATGSGVKWISRDADQPSNGQRQILMSKFGSGGTTFRVIIPQNGKAYGFRVQAKEACMVDGMKKHLLENLERCFPGVTISEEVPSVTAKPAPPAQPTSAPSPAKPAAPVSPARPPSAADTGSPDERLIKGLKTVPGVDNVNPGKEFNETHKKSGPMVKINQRIDPPKCLVVLYYDHRGLRKITCYPAKKGMTFEEVTANIRTFLVEFCSTNKVKNLDPLPETAAAIEVAAPPSPTAPASTPSPVAPPSREPITPTATPPPSPVQPAATQPVVTSAPTAPPSDSVEITARVVASEMTALHREIGEAETARDTAEAARKAAELRAEAAESQLRELQQAKPAQPPAPTVTPSGSLDYGPFFAALARYQAAIAEQKSGAQAVSAIRALEEAAQRAKNHEEEATRNFLDWQKDTNRDRTRQGNLLRDLDNATQRCHEAEDQLIAAREAQAARVTAWQNLGLTEERLAELEIQISAARIAQVTLESIQPFLPTVDVVGWLKEPALATLVEPLSQPVTEAPPTPQAPAEVVAAPVAPAKPAPEPPKDEKNGGTYVLPKTFSYDAPVVQEILGVICCSGLLTWGALDQQLRKGKAGLNELPGIEAKLPPAGQVLKIFGEGGVDGLKEHFKSLGLDPRGASSKALSIESQLDKRDHLFVRGNLDLTRLTPETLLGWVRIHNRWVEAIGLPNQKIEVT